MTPAQFLNRHEAKITRLGECLIWTGATTSGYGRVRHEGVNSAVHRVVYELVNGPVSADMDIDHMCHQRACLNIEHLRVATRAENNRHRLTARHDSASGVRNVYWDAAREKWQAYIRRDGRHVHLGRFTDLEEAKRVAAAARAEQYGEFAGKG